MDTIKLYYINGLAEYVFLRIMIKQLLAMFFNSIFFLENKFMYIFFEVFFKKYTFLMDAICEK